MNSTVKRLIGFSLSAVLAVSGLAGCASGGKDGGKGDGESASENGMGRYLEEEISLPEDFSDMIDLVKMEDGRLWMLGSKESGGFQIWDSRDEGDTWEKATELPEDTFGEEAGIWLSQGALSPKGDGFLMGYAQEDGSNRYYHMTDQGEMAELSMDLGKMEFADEMSGMAYNENMKAASAEEEETGEDGDVPEDSREDETDDEGMSFSKMQNMENSLIRVKYSDDGKLFGNDFNGKLYRINPETGEIEADFGNMVQEFGIAGKNLIAVDYSGNISFFDTETGEPAEQDELLAQGLHDDGDSSASSSVVMMGMERILFHRGEEENTLYYCNGSGVYRCVSGGTVREQLIEGSLNSFGSPDVSLDAFVPLDSGAFLIAVTQSDGNLSLLKYTYSKDTPSRPSKELKVYALEDSTLIRQAISMFQKENADYYVSLEIGMTGEDGVTVSDALKTLNTDILAGKGPDVLVLDGMPVESYMEKGILSELSGIVEKLKAGDGCFENIAGTYSREGKIYAVPSRFSIPVIQADEDTMAAASGLKDFADHVEQLAKDNPEMEGVLGTDSPAALAEKIYQSYSPVMRREDGSLDEEKVREFYAQLKRIYDAGICRDSEENDVSYSFVQTGPGSTMDLSGISENILNLVGESAKVNMGSMGSMMDYSQVAAVNRKLGNVGFGLMQTAGKRVYCPAATLGINSKSSQIESAEKFVEYVLGKEAQSLSLGNGYPINRAAFDASTEDTSNGEVIMGMMISDMFTGEMVELEVYWPEASEFERLKEIIESLDTSTLVDDTIWSAVKEQAEKCLNGELSPEEAADTLISKMKLYLAEQR